MIEEYDFTYLFLIALSVTESIVTKYFNIYIKMKSQKQNFWDKILVMLFEMI